MDEILSYRRYLMALRCRESAAELFSTGEEDLGAAMMNRAMELVESAGYFGNVVELRRAIRSGNRRRAKRCAKRLGLAQLP